MKPLSCLCIGIAVSALPLASFTAVAAWEPTKPVEFVVPAGTGGGAVAVQLVGKHIDSTVNNLTEAESHGRAGKLRPLCVMDKAAMPYKDKLTATMSWADIPTCASAGLPVDYLMLRGIFLPPGVSQDPVGFYLDLFKKVLALPEWKDFMAKGAFNPTALAGAEYVDWLVKNEQKHRTLIRDAGFLPQ